MFWYVLLSIGTLANAQWSKIQCTPPARVDNNVAIMTSQSINNVRTTCSPTDTFKKNIFIQFKRTYTEKPKRVSDSTISFDFSSGGINKFNLEIHNDKLLLNSGDRGIVSSSDKCMAILARREDIFQWVRIRINHLFEIGRTFVSIDLTSYEGTAFIPCLRFEMPIITESLIMRINAYTMAGMKQEIHKITDTTPSLQASSDEKNKKRFQEIESQLNRMETKISRIQEALRKYMNFHDDHVNKVFEQHSNLKKQVIGARNTFESKTTSHFMLWSFIFIASGIGVCFFVNWKVKESKRWGHLM
jgi:hypothetical protein